jgi:hypothetical protein
MEDKADWQVRLDDREAVQLLALDAADGRVLWRYPTADAAGIFAAPRLVKGETGPLIAGGTIYAFDLDGRIVTLDAHDGIPRRISSADIPGGKSLYQIGHTLVVGGVSGGSPFVALDARTGQVLWRRDDVNGHLVSVLNDDVLLIAQEHVPADAQPQFDVTSSWRIRFLWWVQAATGQTLGQLVLEPRIERARFVEGARHFVYFAQGDFVYALGPAAPERAVATARTFLAHGDYRSAVRTLSALKIADERGYAAQGGDQIATEALNAWLAEVDALVEGVDPSLAALKWQQAKDRISTQALRDELEWLQVREAQAHLLYLEAYLEVQDSKPRKIDMNPKVHELRREFGDTVWTERLESLLVAKRGRTLPRIQTSGPLYLGWSYVPFVLPLAVLLVGTVLGRKRESTYRVAVTAGLSCLGGLVYLFWVGNLFLGSKFLAGLARGGPSLPNLASWGFGSALVLGVPLAVWLLTRGKRYALVALAVSTIHLFLLHGSLLTMPVP